MNEEFLETIKIENGKALHLGYHQQRVNKTVGSNRLDLAEVIKPPEDGIYRCRVIYDANDHRVEFFKYTKRHIRKLKLLFDDTIKYDKKYAQREALNRLYEQKGFCDDVIIVRSEYVTDTTIANIAFYDGSDWLTPARPLLCGTTRARLLDEGKIVARDIHYEEIKNFQKIALMNAMIDFDIIAQDNLEEMIC